MLRAILDPRRLRQAPQRLIELSRLLGVAPIQSAHTLFHDRVNRTNIRTKALL
jgi:hypothetical protein